MNSGNGGIGNLLKIGAFSVDVPRNCLVLNRKSYPLEPQIMNVLHVLAELPGEVFSRESLIDRIWKVEFGGDESLTRAISILRKTFKKAGEDDLYIETIYKRGYRLKAPVSEAPFAEPELHIKNVSTEGETSIAVLAFEDMSQNKDQQYFSDGISEEIINALVRFSDLRVTGRTSSFSFKDKDTPIREIANILNVTHIMEGSVRKDGEQLRITVQLIDAGKDQHLWSEVFDGTVDNIFSFQEEITRAVSRKLRLIFGTTAVKKSNLRSKTRTKNTQAYDFFIHGRGLTQQRDGADILPRAIEMLEKAVSIDPNFAEAWAYLARANFYHLEHNKAPGWAGNIVAGRRAVHRALELNPELDLAHSTLGYLALLDLKVDERLLAVEKAHSLNPNSSTFTYTYGSTLASIGQSERGLALMHRAMAQEPLSASWVNGMGHPKFALGDFSGAEADYQRSHNLGFDGAMFMKAILLEHLHGPTVAIDFLQANVKHMGSLSRSMAPTPWRLNLGIRAAYGKSKLARWLICMALRLEVKNKNTQPSAGLSFRCFTLGFPQLFMDCILRHPHPYMGAALAQLWTPTEDAKRIRTHKDFPKFADNIGLVRAWQAYGWPQAIQPVEGTDGSDGQFICK